jgi:cytochrome bd-type quinol oxidase subunit 2
VDPAAFAQLARAWHEYYVLAGTAAATLMGLLFVSLSLHVETLRESSRNHQSVMARSAFVSFLMVMFVSLLMLTPALRQRPLSLSLIMIAVIRIAVSVPALRRTFITERSGTAYGRGYVIAHTALPIAAFLALLAAGVLLAGRHAEDGLEFLMLACTLLLADAARCAWDLLVKVGHRPAIPK